MKRRNFLSGLMAAPLALKARVLALFQRRPVELCGAPVLGCQPDRLLLFCSLPRGHKGPHALLFTR